MLALKRVALENADENLVQGFKGEIDLLKRLRSLERVIQLIDYEMNEEKRLLSVVSLPAMRKHAPRPNPRDNASADTPCSLWKQASLTSTLFSRVARAPQMALGSTPSSSGTTGRRC